MKRDKVEFDRKSFGIMVYGKRTWEDISLREAAKLIGISAATLSRIENGKMPDLVSCKRICDWVHVDMNYFFKK